MTRRVGEWLTAFSPGFLQPYWRRLRASPLWMRLAKGVFWSVLGAVISRGMGVVGSIIVARLIGITAFGEFTVIQSTVGLFGTFAGLGLGITATKYVAELREKDRGRCGQIIGLILIIGAAGGLLAGLAQWAFANVLASRTLAAPQLGPLLRSSAALVLFSALQGVYLGALGGFEAFKRVTRVNWLGAALGTPVMVAATFLWGLEGAVWGSVIQAALGCVVGHKALSDEAGQRGIKMSYGVSPGDFQILWRFSLPAFLSSALAGPPSWICNTFLLNQDGGYREIAYLSAASQWKNLLSFLPLMMSSVLVPLFSSLHHEGRGSEFNKLLLRNLALNVGVCLVLAAPLLIFAPLILGWYGSMFRGGRSAFVLTIACTVIVAANNLLSRAMLAGGRAWTDFTFSALWAVVVVTSAYFLIPSHKAAGLAVAHILAAAALLVWQWLVVRQLFIRPTLPLPAPIATYSN